MKIKTIKKLNLHELIKHVWENDVEDTDFFSNEKLPSGQNVKLHVNPRDFDFGESGKKAGVSLKSHGFVVDDSYTFTVKVEEELTEDRIHKKIYGIYRPKSGESPLLSNLSRMSIREALERTTMSRYELEKAYVLVDNEITLIWTKEKGIPESGVLEVDGE